MKLSVKDLTKLLKLNNTMAARRLARYLDFPFTTKDFMFKKVNWRKSIPCFRITYELPDDHPFVLSYNLIKNQSIAKPIYTISQIAKMWRWRKGNYSTEWVRQLLDKYNIPVYHKKYKGYVYLVDLNQLLDKQQELYNKQVEDIKLLPTEEEIEYIKQMTRHVRW